MGVRRWGGGVFKRVDTSDQFVASRSRRQIEKAGGGMSDILYGGVDGAKGIFGQWAAYVGMTSSWLSSSLTTVGAEGVMAAVVDADGEGAWTGWT